MPETGTRSPRRLPWTPISSIFEPSTFAAVRRSPRVTSAILRTIYAGSTNRYTIETARLLDADMALVHVQAILDAPAGPFAGRNHALFSMVLVRSAAEWQIASFHNTLQPPALDHTTYANRGAAPARTASRPPSG